MSSVTKADALFKKALSWGSVLITVIALVGSALGYFLAGTEGLASALIGAALALGFTSLTLLSMLIGRKLSIAGLFGVVMGGWLVKLLGFAFLVAALRDASYINGPVLFFTLVAAILGSLVIDSRLVLTARIPVVEG